MGGIWLKVTPVGTSVLLFHFSMKTFPCQRDLFSPKSKIIDITWEQRNRTHSGSGLLWCFSACCSVCVSDFLFSCPPPLFYILILSVFVIFLDYAFTSLSLWFLLTLLILFSVLFAGFFLSCSLSAASCLRCVGTAGSQSECSQSGAGGQHLAGERCFEDKPSRSRTGNKAREHHLEF